MSDWSSLPIRAKLYIAITVIAALPVFYFAIHFVVLTPLNRESISWIALTFFTLITVPLYVFLPSARSGVTIGDAFVMSICMTSGIETAIIANTLYISGLTLLLKRRYNTPAHRITFNIATAVINVYLYGTVYYLLLEVLASDAGTVWRLAAPADKILPIFGAAITFFFSNSLFIAIAISLSSSEKFIAVWNNYSKLALDFLLSACAAAIIALFVPELFPQSRIAPYIGPVLLAPFIGAVYIINQVNRSKALAAEQHLTDQEQLYFRTVGTLALAVDAKDQTTYGHIRRVRAYAMGLAKLCGITEANELKAIEYGSLLHDIGKLAIEDYILNKPGRLNKEEFEKMKVHATAGDEILQQVEFPFPVAKYVRYHHERWDGKGYPDGLRANEIPLGARILSIADAFDAIRSTRPYKSAFSIHDSIELLRAQSGISYDPFLINLFITHIDELEESAENAAKNISELTFRRYYESRHSPSAPSQDIIRSNTTEELLHIFEFCSGVGRSLDLSDSLCVVAHHLKSVVHYDVCAFYICQNDDSAKIEYACGNFSESLIGRRVSLGKGISGWVAAYKQPMSNTAPNLEFADDSDLSSLQDTLCVPVIHDQQCLGTISLFSKAPSSFSQSDLSFVQILAEQLSFLLAPHPSISEDKLLDPLTQTRRINYLSLVGPKLLSQATASDLPVCLVSLEIKNFLSNTSLYGPSGGDTMISQVAAILRSELRQSDILVRFGHHGFIALLPGIPRQQALRYINRLQQQIKNTPILLPTGNAIYLSCAIGISTYPTDGGTILSLMQVAQNNLRDNSQPLNQPASTLEGNVFEFPPRN